jgi:hypothetical protein
MPSELPSPPIPANADLRDFQFTPIFRARLFGSSFHARSTDAEWRAGVTLWLKSWDQVPPGSLPDDDIDLCRLAELGRDMKLWATVKSGALRGWYKCSDGLLYHAVVAEGVLEGINRKTAHRNKTLKARIAALQKRLKESTDSVARAHMTEELENLLLTQLQTMSLTSKRSVTDSVTDSVTGSVTELVTEEGNGTKRRDRDRDRDRDNVRVLSRGENLG